MAALQVDIFFGVCVVGIAAGIILLPLPYKTKRVIDILWPIIKTYQQNIKNTISKVLGNIDNMGQVGSNVSETTYDLKIPVPVILQEARVTYAAKGSIESEDVIIWIPKQARGTDVSNT